MFSSKYKKQFLFLILAALWGALIFYLSNQPDLSTGLPNAYESIFMILAHIFVFMVLTYFLAGSLNSDQRKYLLFIIIAALVYAVIDELHQTQVAGRVGDPKDILTDAIGVYLGIWLYKIKSPDKLLK